MNLLKKLLDKTGIFKAANVSDDIDKENGIKVLTNIVIMLVIVTVIVKIIVILL